MAIRDMGAEAWVEAARPQLIEVGATAEDIDVNHDWYVGLYPLVVAADIEMEQIPQALAFLFWGQDVRLDEGLSREVFQGDDSESVEEGLQLCRYVMADLYRNWDSVTIRDSVVKMSASLDFGPERLFDLLGIAIMGDRNPMPLFESMVYLKREEAISRVDHVLWNVIGE